MIDKKKVDDNLRKINDNFKIFFGIRFERSLKRYKAQFALDISIKKY